MDWLSFKAEAWGNGKRRKYFWDLRLMTAGPWRRHSASLKFSFHLYTEEDNYCAGCVRDVKQSKPHNKARTGSYCKSCALPGFARATRNYEDFISYTYLMHMMKVGQLLLRLVSISLHSGTRAQLPLRSMTWGMILVQTGSTCYSSPVTQPLYSASIFLNVKEFTWQISVLFDRLCKNAGTSWSS